MPAVLIVDDSAVERRIVAGLLRKQDAWDMSEASDGRDALEQIALRAPDVVVTDLQMPVMDGLGLVRAVRQQYPLVPVVLMTSQGSEEIAVRALEAGAASYVPKSDLPVQLIEVLERVLAAAGENRSLSQLMRSMTTWQADFQLDNDPAVLLSLVAHLQRLMTEMRLFDESERLRVGVALEEALLNASYHGNLEVSSKLREQDHSAYYDLANQRMTEQPYSDRKVSVRCTMTTEGVRYVIKDEGPGFDRSSLPDPTDPMNLERPCGRGLLLMQTFMDEIAYNDAGNQVTMVKSVTISDDTELDP